MMDKLKMNLKTVKENLCLKMATFIKVHLKMIKEKVKAL